MAGNDPAPHLHPPVALSPELPLQLSAAEGARLVEALAAAAEPAAVAERLLAALVRRLPEAAGVVFARMPEAPQLQPLATHGIEPAVAERLSVLADRPWRRPALSDADALPGTSLVPIWRSLLTLPLVVGNERLGAAVLLLRSPYRLVPAAATVLAGAAGAAALALRAVRDRQALVAMREQLAAERRARRQAEALAAGVRLEPRGGIDPLTGLASSRRFHAALDVEVERARRYGDPLGLLLIDIDRFKRFNETFGQAEGDRVLTELAGLLRQSLRKIDSAFRYGGEEFTAILPRCDRDAVFALAERLRRRVGHTEFRPRERLTVSIGAAVYERGAPVASFIRQADDALYRAKLAGRDRVVLA